MNWGDIYDIDPQDFRPLSHYNRHHENYGKINDHPNDSL